MSLMKLDKKSVFLLIMLLVVSLFGIIFIVLEAFIYAPSFNFWMQSVSFLVLVLLFCIFGLSIFWLKKGLKVIKVEQEGD